jgi:hypothetical protein
MIFNDAGAGPIVFLEPFGHAPGFPSLPYLKRITVVLSL